MISTHIIFILLAWMVAGGSPGPATLAISGTSMQHGRKSGLIMASGIVAGSATWGIASALGMSAIMFANAWVFEVIRYAGAMYLLFLAIKSLRSAIENSSIQAQKKIGKGYKLFIKGFSLHITNPKAILSWGAVYALALQPNASPSQVWILFILLMFGSIVVFFGYALLFSLPRISALYLKSKRWFEATFAIMFGAASLKLLTARLS